KLALVSQFTTAELTKGLPEAELYSSMPLSGAFFINNGAEAYIATGRYTFTYDVIKKSIVKSHVLPVNQYISVAAFSKKNNEILLSISENATGGIFKQSLADFSTPKAVIKEKAFAYKMKMCDSLLICYCTDKYFVLNTDAGKIIHEVTLPVTKTPGLDKAAAAIANKREPITSPDGVNFKPEEYVLDIDYLRKEKKLIYATNKEVKVIDPATKKLSRTFKGIFTNVKISSTGNRMITNGYLFYRSLRIYNPTDFSIVSERMTMGNSIYSTNLSPNKKWLYTNGANSGYIWNLSNFTKHAEIKDLSGSDSSFVMSVYFLNDSEVVVNSGTSISHLNLFIYNFIKKKLVSVLKKDVYAVSSGFVNNEFYYADYSHLNIMNLATKKEETYEGLYSMAAVPSSGVINYTNDLVFVPKAGKFSVINRKTKKSVYESDSWAVNSKVLFSDDGKFLFTTAQITKKKKLNGYEYDAPVSAIVKIDLENKRILTDYAETYYVLDFKLKDNGKKLAIWYINYDPAVYTGTEQINEYTEYDVASGSVLFTKTIDKTPTIMPYHYTSESGNYFCMAGVYDDYLKVFNEKGEAVVDMKQNGLSAPKCFFVEEKGMMIVTSPFNSMATFIDLKKNKMIGQLANADKDQFFLITSDLNYLGSKEFVKNIRFKYKNEMYGFEQFDAYLNQPHQVLRAFGCSDSALIKAYEKAYTKRLKVLGIKPGFKVNFASLPNFHEVKMKEEKNGEVKFSVSANKGVDKLKSIKVVNNGSVVLTENIPANEADHFQKDFVFETSSGINRFEFVTTDEKGLESPHVTRFYNNTSIVKPDLYIAVIASEKFKNTEYDLTYAVKDATDMANTMANSKSFNKINIKKIFNKSFSPDSIGDLKKFFQPAGVNDVVMIFFAGHGFLDGDFSYYFPTYYTDFEHPNVNSVSYNSFEKLLKEVKPLRKLMFIDACFSGEVDKDDLFINEEPKNTKDTTRSLRAATAVFAQSTALEMSKTVFSDLRQSSGATIISSAGGTEAALEGAKWNNGLFTHCLLDGLSNLKADYNVDGKISLSELQKFVAEEVHKLSGGKQMPTYRLENTVLDYELW
ncbi:MAG TPA: caspase family protein, partial [Bacteroidia bacterium]